MENCQTPIKCGWENCQSWFSTGKDMNEHVLLNHIEFMEISVNALKMMKEPPKPTLKIIPPPSPTSSVGSIENKTFTKFPCMSMKCSAEFDTKSEVRAHYTAEHITKPTTEKRKTTETTDDNTEPKKQKTDETPPIEKKTTPNSPKIEQIEPRISPASTRLSLGDNNNLTGTEKPKEEPISPDLASSGPLELVVDDEPLKFSRKSKFSENCQFIVEKIDSLPDSRFSNTDSLQFCLPCLRFKTCDLQHDNVAIKLANTWQKKYEKTKEIDKTNLMKQFRKLRKLYIKKESETVNTSMSSTLRM